MILLEFDEALEVGVMLRVEVMVRRRGDRGNVGMGRLVRESSSAVVQWGEIYPPLISGLCSAYVV